MTVVRNWVYARSWSAWSMTPLGIFGALPKAEVICGHCSLHSKTRAQESTGDEIFVWCPHCGRANILRDAYPL